MNNSSEPAANKMEFFDNLMIRACKSGLPKEKIIARLLKIWARRCALPRQYARPNELLQYGLFALVEKYNPIKLGEFFRRMENFNLMLEGWPKCDDATTNAIVVCISQMQLTERDKLPGYVAQLGFRNHWTKWEKGTEEQRLAASSIKKLK